MITEFFNYREYLQSLFEIRIKRNERYSLRAFARDLDIHPARLSDVLKQKYGLSIEAAVRIAQRLGLNRYDTEYFCDMVLLDNSKSKEVSQLAKRRLEEKRDLRGKMINIDTHRFIADWYHIAIMEVCYLDSFNGTISWICNALDLEEKTAKEAIERLIRLGLMEKTDNGYQKKDKFLTTTENVPSEAILKVNDQILQKAQIALLEQAVEERDFSSVTFAINPKKIDEARRIISKCRHELIRLLEEGKRTELYCFSAQLFRLGKNKG